MLKNIDYHTSINLIHTFFSCLLMKYHLFGYSNHIISSFHRSTNFESTNIYYYSILNKDSLYMFHKGGDNFTFDLHHKTNNNYFFIL